MTQIISKVIISIISMLNVPNLKQELTTSKVVLHPPFTLYIL